MARVTVEDCLPVVPDRFELVALASQRARSINSGASVAVPRDGDKSPVISLREIASGAVDIGHLRENLIQSFQRYVEDEEASSRFVGESAGEENFSSTRSNPLEPPKSSPALSVEGVESGSDELY